MPNTPLPIPSNMGGQQQGNPYRTPWNWGRFGSDVLRGIALPGPVNVADRFTGNNIQGLVDRWFGATDSRSLQDYNNYMRGMMRSDPGNRSSLGNWFRNLFSGGGGSDRGQQPQQPGGAETFPIPDFNQNPVSSGGGGGGGRPSGGNRNTMAPGRGQVIARRIEGDTQNNRDLERMAEGLLGQSAVQRMQASSRLSRDMMNRMFGNEFY